MIGNPMPTTEADGRWHSVTESDERRGCRLVALRHYYMIRNPNQAFCLHACKTLRVGVWQKCLAIHAAGAKLVA